MSDMSLRAILNEVKASSAHKNIQGVTHLREFLNNNEISSCRENDVSALFDWFCVRGLRDTNHKNVRTNLESLSVIVDQLGEEVQSFFNQIIDHLIDRLGDNQQLNRDMSLVIIIKLMHALGPNAVFDRLLPTASKHRNARVREYYLVAYVGAIKEYGANSIEPRTILPSIAKLSHDPDSKVREAAAQCLEALYYHTGDALLSYLEAKHVRKDVFTKLEQRFSGLPVVPLEERIDIRRPPSEKKSRSKSRGGGLRAKTASNKSSRASSKQSSRSGSRRESPDTSPRYHHHSRTSLRSASSKSRQKLEEDVDLELDESIVPIKITQGRSLTKHLNEIVGVIRSDPQSAKGHWQKKIDALRRLCGIVMGGATSFPEFKPFLRAVRDPMSALVTDLRSSIVREACTTVVYLSRQLRSEMTDLADYILPSLLKSVPVTVFVISESAHRCLLHMLAATPLKRSVKKLLQECSSKHEQVRIRTSEYLMTFLETCDDKRVLKKHCDETALVIKKIITDRTEDVRANGRSCFWAFHRHFPDKSNELLKKTSGTVARMLRECEDQYNEDAQLRHDERIAALNAAGAVMDARKSAVVRRRREAPKRAESDDAAKISTTTKPASNMKLSKRSKSRPRSTKRKLRPTRIPVSPEEKEVIPKLTRPEAVPMERTPTHTKKHGSKARRTISSDDNNNKSGLSGAARRTPAYKSNHTSINNNNNNKALKSGATRIQKRGNSKPDDALNLLNELSSDPTIVAARLVRDSARNNSDDDDNYDDDNDLQQQQPQHDDVKIVHAGSRQNALKKVLDDSKSHSIAMRLRALGKLENILQESVAVADILVKLKALVELFERLMGDKSEKVAIKALGCIEHFLEVTKLKVIPYLHRLIPSILRKMQENRNSACFPLANAALMKIHEDFGNETLYPILLELTQIQDQKLQRGVLEFLHHLMLKRDDNNGGRFLTTNISTQESFFYQASNCTLLLQRLHRFVAGDDTRMSDICLSLYMDLIEGVYSDIFIGQLTQLSRDKLRIIVPKLQAFLPDIEARLAQFERGQHGSIDVPEVSESIVTTDEKHQGNNDDDDDNKTSPSNNNNNSSSSNSNINDIVESLSSSSNERKLNAINDLSKLMNSNPKQLNGDFDSFYLPLLDVLEATDDSLRTNALEAVIQCLDCFHEKFKDITYSDLLTIHLLEVFRSSSSQLHTQVDKAMTAMQRTVAPRQIFSVLLTSMESEQKNDSQSNIVVQAATKSMSKIMDRVEEHDLRASMDRLIPTLAMLMKSKSAMVRKNVVVVFVAMYHKLGEDLMPYLNVLNVSQRKLIKVYISRATKDENSKTPARKKSLPKSSLQSRKEEDETMIERRHDTAEVSEDVFDNRSDNDDDDDNDTNMEGQSTNDNNFDLNDEYGTDDLLDGEGLLDNSLLDNSVTVTQNEEFVEELVWKS